MSATLALAAIGVVTALALIFGPKTANGFKNVLNPFKALQKGADTILDGVSNIGKNIESKIQKSKEKAATRKTERIKKREARKEKRKAQTRRFRNDVASASKKLKSAFNPRNKNSLVKTGLSNAISLSPAVQAVKLLRPGAIRRLPKVLPNVGKIRTIKTDGRKFRINLKRQKHLALTLRKRR